MTSRLTILALALVAAVASGCQRSDAAPASASAAAAAAARRPTRVIRIARREGKVREYPCLKCHDKITAVLQRPTPIKRHTAIRIKHFKGADACYVCHDTRAMNRLALLSGESVGYDASYELCGQCHGEKRRDFAIGAHGKLVGGWRGTAYKYNCVDCHDPHHPKRAAVNALPPPPFPARGIRKSRGAHR
ncbi:MAG: hypothetical protein KC503_37725 [Myxococcales bacterium]|nr:hypothetical protein [Myxococcales bacterium]